jgi:hypothetical protein
MLKWTFGADTGPFRKGLAQMRGEVSAFSGSIKGQIAGALGGAALAAGFSKMLDELGRVKDLADRFGMTSESIQRLGYAAKLSGSDTETLAKALTKMKAGLAEAEGGSSTMIDAFDALGISVEEFKKLSVEDQLVAISKGYAEAGNNGQAFAAVLKLLGKGGAELTPLLVQGPKALKEQMDEAKVASEGAVNAAANMGDKIDKLKQIAVPIFGWIIQAIATLPAYFEYAGSVIASTLEGIFGGVAESVSYALEAIKELLKGNIEEAMKLDGMAEKALDNAFKRASDARGAAYEKLTDKLGAIYSNNADPTGARAAEAAAKKATEIAKEMERLIKERETLAKDIAKTEEDARIAALALDEKILDATRRRAEAIEKGAQAQKEATAAAEKGKGHEIEAMEAGNAVLEAAKQRLEIEAEIARYKKEQADADGKAAKAYEDFMDKDKAKKEELAKLEAESAKLDRDRKLASMSDVDRADALKQEQDRLRAEAEEFRQKAKLAEESVETARNPADAYEAAQEATKAALEKEIEAKRLQSEIDSALKSAESARTKAEEEKYSLLNGKDAQGTISTSALAAIGGGGTANLIGPGIAHEKKVEDLLSIIAANTARGDDGSDPKMAEMIY